MCEIEFLNSYLELTRLRYTNKVEIKTSFQKELKDVTIPPMLFIVFIENAFKHGISYKSKSYVHIELKQRENTIEFRIRNSVQNMSKNNHDEVSGIGLTNVKKRLALIYGDQYTLNIINTEKEYDVSLMIPAYDN